MATKNSSAPKWRAKCLELVREMSFPVVVAPTVYKKCKYAKNVKK